MGGEEARKMSRGKWAVVVVALCVLAAVGYATGGCGPSPGGSTQELSSPAAPADSAQEDSPSVAPGDRGQDIVHATRTGQRYHRAGCRHLAKSDIPMSRQEAEAKGLTPCGTCKP